MLLRIHRITRLAVISIVAVLFLLFVYHSYGSDRQPLLQDATWRKQGKQNGDDTFPLHDLHQLAPLTQSPQHLEKLRNTEAKMLQNIQRMMEHRQLSIARANASLGYPSYNSHLRTPPSLWDGITRRPSIDINEQKQSTSQLLNNPNIRAARSQLIVHLDLKGAPPKVKYLKDLFQFLHSLGATGLLIEYEDMFPYSGLLNDLRAENAYSREDLKLILEYADNSNLVVIPLIQTFGHMEFFLKLPKFQLLREIPDNPQSICPSNNASWLYLKTMVDQILDFHPGIQHLLLGCDEVYQYAVCPLCTERMIRESWTKYDLFLNHIHRLAKYVKEVYNIQPIVWDDMFRSMPSTVIKESGVWELVDLMAWQYQASDRPDFGVWDMYISNAKGVWVASAFKGALYPNTVMTDIGQRLANHRMWISMISRLMDPAPLKGFVLTGWQRYDHFAVLCELLPVGLISLSVNMEYLKTLREEDEVITAKVQELLQCNQPVSLLPMNITDDTYIQRCSFPGSEVYDMVQHLLMLRYQVRKLLDDNHLRGWVSPYNIRNQFSSPPRLQVANNLLQNVYFMLNMLKSETYASLSNVYDESVIKEWYDTYVEPIQNQLDTLQSNIQSLLRWQTWPRRPLPDPLPTPRLRSDEARISSNNIHSNGNDIGLRYPSRGQPLPRNPDVPRIVYPFLSNNTNHTRSNNFTGFAQSAGQFDRNTWKRNIHANEP